MFFVLHSDYKSYVGVGDCLLALMARDPETCRPRYRKHSGFAQGCATFWPLSANRRSIMKLILKVLALAVVIVLVVLLASTRLDGPRGLLAGGAFQSGERLASPASWQFLEGQDTLEFQTEAPERSRTVWLVVHEGRLFLVSGYMNTLLGKVWKHWPFQIQENPNILIRDRGKIYEQRLTRIVSGQIAADVMRKFSNKYGLADVSTSDESLLAMLAAGDAWLFEVVSR